MGQYGHFNLGTRQRMLRRAGTGRNSLKDRIVLLQLINYKILHTLKSWSYKRFLNLQQVNVFHLFHHSTGGLKYFCFFGLNLGYCWLTAGIILKYVPRSCEANLSMQETSSNHSQHPYLLSVL